MPQHSQRAFGPLEVRRTDKADSADPVMVRKADRLADIPLEMAKVGMGCAIGKGIGDDPYKVYGDTGLIARVVSGDKVPEYLARIYVDPAARQRFGLALLEGTPGAEFEMTVRIKRTA